MRKGMVISLITSLLLFLLSCSNARAQTAAPPIPTLTPPSTPAPTPANVNLTDLFTVAGPFHNFLGYLKSTQVIDAFQNQANNSQNGITIFAPKDDAFSSLKSPSLSNLTKDQLRSVCLFHALPMFYSLADFKNLSQAGAVATYAGDQYTLNFTYTFGLVQLSSGWTNTKITSSVLATKPVAIYELDKVLLPEAIYGTNIPPPAAPAPSPDITPTADAPTSEPNASASQTTASTKGTLLISISVILNLLGAT